MYTIETDNASRVITLTLVGFWSVETAQDFTRDQQVAVARLGPPYGTHLTLVDARQFDIQMKEVVALIRDLVMNARTRSKRIALIGEGNGLAKMQFARIVDRHSSRLFADVEEGRRWLIE